MKKKAAKNFANVKDNGCWECGADDHQRKDCPVFQMKQMKKFKKEEALSRRLDSMFDVMNRRVTMNTNIRQEIRRCPCLAVIQRRGP